MKLQVLLSAMNQKDHSILDSMNLQSPAIVVNQSDEFNYEQIEYKGSDILFLTLPERGVGLSRNTALMRADADIVLLSDQNVVYDDGYQKTVTEAFRRIPRADVLVFNIPIDDPKRKTYTITKEHRVRKYNSLRYGAVRMAIRLDSAKKASMSFSLLFGGGAKYSSGEDSLFIYEALSKKLKVYAIPERIGKVKQHESTWFNGYTDEFFIDKGALFKALSSTLYRFMILQFIIRKKKTIGGSNRKFRDMMKLMLKGAREYDR